MSSILRELAEDRTRQRITVDEFCAVFKDRALGALIFVFAAPNVLPIPLPGISALMGLPLLFLTLQLTFGRSVPWLPGWIGQRSFERTDLSSLVSRIDSWLVKLETYLRPRLVVLLHPPGERIVGLVGLVLAAVLFLPIPLGNMLPGLALALAGLAIMERDGVILIVAGVIALASLVIAAGVAYGMALAAIFLMNQMLAVT
jgi:hypothetical protein